MEGVEEDFFISSINILVNKKNWELVFNDELISAHTTDVRNKTMSFQKASKEGPVADAIADSHLGCFFYMLLRAKGETKIENIMKLFWCSPTILSNNSTVSV